MLSGPHVIKAPDFLLPEHPRYRFVAERQHDRSEGFKEHCLKHPELALLYVLLVHKKRLLQAEPLFASWPFMAVLYAQYVLRKPFKRAEPLIAQHPELALRYARVLGLSRFREAEGSLSTQADYSYAYARTVLKGRFKQGEAVLARHPHYAIRYARYVLRSPFPEAEGAILGSDATMVYLYAKYVKRGRWPEAEIASSLISRHTSIAMRYARFVVQGPWRALEEQLSGRYLMRYIEYVIRGPYTPLEPYLAHREQAVDYAAKVLKGRFVLAEDSLLHQRHRQSKETLRAYTEVLRNMPTKTEDDLRMWALFEYRLDRESAFCRDAFSQLDISLLEFHQLCTLQGTPDALVDVMALFSKAPSAHADGVLPSMDLSL